MLFRRLFLCALLVGLCSGLVHSAVQRWQVLPLIAASEGFEAAAAAAPDHDHADASTVWAPANGAERGAWTVIANVLSGTGYALLMLPLMAWWEQRSGRHAASWRSGLLWGAAGWCCLFALPALGLPPVLPGSAAAALHARQAWWLLAAVSGVAALALLCLGREHLGRARWLAIALPLLPFAIGAPHADGSSFPGQSSEAALQLQALSERFVLATGVATAAYWLVLGALAGAAVARWVRPLMPGSETPPEPLTAPAGALR